MSEPTPIAPEDWMRAMAVLAALCDLPLARERIELFADAPAAMQAEHVRVRETAGAAEPATVFDPRWD
jgi:hypothetical protein